MKFGSFSFRAPSAAPSSSSLSSTPALFSSSASVSPCRDLLFVAFHIYLLAQFYNIYGTNLNRWNGMQLILSSILVVGDPMFHAMGSFKLKGPWVQNIEPVLYMVMLAVTATRSIIRQHQLSSYKSLAYHITAIAVWTVLKWLPQPEDILALSGITGTTMIESILAVAFLRGTYLSILSSELPVLTTEPGLLFDPDPCRALSSGTFVFMTLWSFLIPFIQQRSQLAVEARRRGIWSCISGDRKEKDTGTSDQGKKSCSAASTSSAVHVPVPWRPDYTYSKGAIVTVPMFHPVIANWLRIKSPERRYELLNRSASSRYSPGSAFNIFALLDPLLVSDVRLEGSIIFHIATAVLAALSLAQVGFAAVFSGRRAGFLSIAGIGVAMIIHCRYFYLMKIRRVREAEK